MTKKSVKPSSRSETGKKNLREKLTEALDLPKELMLNIPKLILIGNGDMMIENYKGIKEYGDKCVRVNTGSGIVKIEGNGLIIKEITSEDIIISGKISLLEFVTDIRNS